LCIPETNIHRQIRERIMFDTVVHFDNNCIFGANFIHFHIINKIKKNIYVSNQQAICSCSKNE
jgi:hypothetical protein